jgi:hypothetical protein
MKFKIYFCKSYLLLLFIFLDFSLLFAQNSANKYFKDFKPKSYVCYKITSHLQIDGNLDKEDWEKAAWTDYFVDIEGNKKPLPRFKTRAKMLWDDKYLYIAAELEEPDIRATLRQRDTVIFYDNDFEVFIDPDGDTHQYYEFEMNAFNTVWDLLLFKPYRDGGSGINNWDIKGLKSGVKINGTINQPGDKDKNWTVEIAFPWESLKECTNKNAPPKSGEQWRINFSRVEWLTEVIDGNYKKVINPKTGKPYPEDNWVWSPQGVINMHCPEMWAFIQFSDKSVGSGEDKFVYNSEENAKWALRLVYYEQNKYFDKNGKYTSDIKKLGLDLLKIDGYIWPPVIQITENRYEAFIKKIRSKEKWHISEDGRTWKK